MNGVLVIDKPEGLTSHDVVNKVRRILQTKSVGHTGTLDPFATGVLVVLVGRATRLAQFLDKAEKEYAAVVRFGYQTNTGDLTGEITVVAPGMRAFATTEVEDALNKLRGTIEQTPPMFSAKKINGKKLYELARQGEKVERQSARVTIHKLETEHFEDDQLLRFNGSTIDLKIRVVCSAGTYIRVLAEDIGANLGVGAHLASLRRTRAGGFDLKQAVTLEQLELLASENKLAEVFITPNQALAHLPLVTLDQNAARKTINGNKFYLPSNHAWQNGQLMRMCDEAGNLIAVGAFEEESQAVQPRVVLQMQD